jgi:hypothetical protein
VNPSLPQDADVYSLAVSGAYLFAGTNNATVWRRPLSEMVSSVEVATNGSLPDRFVLEQNYPNPFNPSTTIEFSLSHPGLVSLKVLSLLGEEITTLVSQELPAGSYRSRWDARGVSSGVYFYRLVAGSFVETKKMLFFK